MKAIVIFNSVLVATMLELLSQLLDLTDSVIFRHFGRFCHFNVTEESYKYIRSLYIRSLDNRYSLPEVDCSTVDSKSVRKACEKGGLKYSTFQTRGLFFLAFLRFGEMVRALLFADPKPDITRWTGKDARFCMMHVDGNSLR